jgi:succinate-semialdehyde dehydrogenase/glutarate-semialdehyde dehydrogenase
MAYRSINPFTEELLSSFQEDTDVEVEAILATSESIFLNDWRRRSFSDRGAILKKAAAILRERCNELAAVATAEMGKLYRDAQTEIRLCANIFDYYAENAERFLAPRKLDVEKGEAYVETAPLGPIFCIEPWNFPFYQLARVAAPNLMAGNVIVMKHAPSVPQCALAFAAVLSDAGAPPGVYANVFLTNEQAANVIADHRIKAVALTGSERAGAAVAAAAGKALKKSTMELGGSDPFIVLEDANLEFAVNLAVVGRIFNNGQACTGSKRFIVVQSIADEFTDRFTRAFENMVAGDPMAEETTIGPLASEQSLKLAIDQIETAVLSGAELLTGGERLDRPGFFLAPTVLTKIQKENPAYYQEFFAPVAMLFVVRDEEAAIALANDSPFGLGSSVVTKDLARAKRVASQLDAGMVFINSTPQSAPELPFGGVKNSGFGRELSDLGIGEFVNKKLVRIR